MKPLFPIFPLSFFSIFPFLLAAADFAITDFGAKPDGAKCTAAFAEAVGACAAAGGGRVVVPAGTWYTGAIHLRSNVELHLAEGSKLLFSDDPKDFLPAVPSTWEGLECLNLSPLVYAYGCTNVAITGKGTLRAKMDFWAEQMKESRTKIQEARAILYKWGSEDWPVEKRDIVAAHPAVLRPQLIQFNRCKGVRIEGIRVEDSPFWTIHLFMSEDVTVRGIDVCAHGFNNDGIDIEMTQNVLVEDSTFDQGDDGFVFKAGRNRDAWRVARPTKNVEIRNCHVKKAASLVGVGSELSGGIENVYVHDCTVDSVNRLYYVKTNRRRGGFVRNIRLENVSTRHVEKVVALETDVLYQWAAMPDYETRLTEIEGLYVRNVSCEEARRGIDLVGDARLPARKVRIENVHVGRTTEGFRRIENVEDVEVKNVTCGVELDVRAVGAELGDDGLFCIVGESGKASFSLDVGFPSWEPDTYVMLPSAAYGGNRAFESIPLHASGSMWFRDGDIGTNCPYVLNARLPSMGRDGKGVLEGGVGDLAAPTACFFFPKAKKGVIVHFEPAVAGRYTGFYVTNGLFRVQYPARRYELLQGRADAADDPPIAAKPGETIVSQFRVRAFDCADVPALFEEYFNQRKSFLPGERAPLQSGRERDYAVRLTANQLAASSWYGSPDARETWVSGWCGGPIYVAALLRANFPGARDMAAQTLDFMADTQDAFGMFRGKSRDGVAQPERPRMPETVRFHLTRRSADGLYWGFDLLAAAGSTSKRENALRRCADAFLALLGRYGSIPEYVEAGSGECLVGGTTGAAILPAALVRAAGHFREPKYLEAAKAICEGMCRDHLSRGLCFGGAGDAGNAPDSESCAALLRSCVTLAERTGEAKWTAWARQAAHVLSTWVVSYRFPFPPTSEFGRLGVNSVGSVVANLQNRHAAPGFCIDDGDSLLRLAKLTGDARYREMYEDVRAFMPQVISLPERPVLGTMCVREPYQMAFGAMYERVNLSGWEGFENIGETYWRGAWCMASFLLMGERVEKGEQEKSKVNGRD